MIKPSKIIFIFGIFLLASCTQADSYNITMGSINLSDSYIYPYTIALNEDGGIPGGGLAECSEHVGLNAIAHTTTTKKPQFVTVAWEHLLSRKAYRAKVLLNAKTLEWLRQPPFKDYDPEDAAPALVVQWRGNNKVAVMLAADFTRFSKGTMDLGEAAGEEIPKPDWGPNNYITYEDIAGSDDRMYKPGRIKDYSRDYDGALSIQQRFGCPRLPNGNIDVSQLPPKKLPFLTGEHGEHIPCKEYFCADKQELQAKLMSLPRQQYPKDKQPPPITFQDAPNPRPAW